MGLDEDLSHFIDTGDFADAVTVGGQALNALFRNEYREENGHIGRRPELYCAESDLPTIVGGTTVAVHNEVNYLVTAVESEGNGMARLLLRKAS